MNTHAAKRGRLFFGTLVSAFVTALALLTLGCAEDEPARPVSVLLVTLDATRADALSSYDASHGNTPNLDALAAESLFFRNAVASTPYTGPAHASILTGHYPPRHGLRDYLVQALPQTADTLAERFREAGYDTAAFVSAYVLAPRFGLDQGFDVYTHRPRTLQGGAGSDSALARMFYQRPADDTVDDALEWLGEREPGTPFFAWVHFYDPHQPWQPPAELAHVGGSPGSPEDARALYYLEMTFVDQQIGRLLESLRAIGRYDDLVVAVTADHGELLGLHGRALGGHSPELVEATLRIPLFVRAPGQRAAAEYDTQVRALDLFPTLLEAAGLPVPEGLAGESLFRVAQGDPDRPAYSETLYEHYPKRSEAGDELVSLQHGGWRLLTRPGREQLFDLKADPGEGDDLAAREPERVAAMRRMLYEMRQSWPADAQPQALELSEDETREHLEGLRALGYVE